MPPGKLNNQRAAVEWVRDNIPSFGGNPKKITLWGQSTGAASIVLYDLAYPSDPIAHGFIEDYGSVYLLLCSDDNVSAKSFSPLAKAMNCSGAPDHELSCLRNFAAPIIQSYLDVTEEIEFSPVKDNITVFQNNKARYAAKQYAQVPIIAGANVHEETDAFLCLSDQGIKYRAAATSQPIFFYHYHGNSSNIAPIPSAGAYHSSELPLIMGTFNDINGLGPEFQTEISRTLQDPWLAFTTDPTQGLVASGWEPYPSAVIFGDTTKEQVFQSVQVSEVPGWNECLPVDA
ncbi:unnamed protein product [Clonostachys rhizophaga]|uniref:Carboxylic ester hydrolase n=1 Tax=Clonostachys rhizophaga TaxID=160324 RepID=A0A9N9VKJ7_9HYPO|nr:unnamed protein product [Clonostachys rhizophaga]